MRPELPVAAVVCRRRKRGTVASILEARPADGMSTVVTVRWDSSPKWTETWATDCLVVVSTGGDMSRPAEGSAAA